MLKLKLQYFGHLKQRADSLEKTLTPGKMEVRRRRMCVCEPQPDFLKSVDKFLLANMLISCHDRAQAPCLSLRLDRHVAFSLGSAWGCVCGKHSAPGGRERSRQRPPYSCTKVAHWGLGFPHVNFRGTQIFRPQ